MHIASPTPDSIRKAVADGPGVQTILLGAKASARKIAEAMTALANAHGGLVILGAAKSRKITGVSDPETVRERMTSAALIPNPPLILPLPKLLEVDGATVCVVQVPAGLPHVYSLRGQYLVRAGRDTRPMAPHELQELLLNRSEASYESQIPRGIAMNALGRDRVQA